jgi:hypothetical protein
MPFQVEHEIHKRRFGRNLGVGLLLGAFVCAVFALTYVKVTRGMPLGTVNTMAPPDTRPVVPAP